MQPPRPGLSRPQAQPISAKLLPVSEFLTIAVDVGGALWRADAGALCAVTDDDLAAAARVTLVVPGEAVVSSAVDLPPVRQATRRRAAARYALEERLATPVEELHVALGPRASDGSYPTAAVAHGHIQAWLEALGPARAAARVLAPDYLCLPQSDSQDHAGGLLWLAGGRALYRNGSAGFACETELLPALLPAPQADGAALTVRVAEAVGEDDTTAADAVAALQERGFILEQGPPLPRADQDEHASDGAAPLLAALLAAAPLAPAINLLQDRYAPVSARDTWWRPLRATAALLALWLGLLVAAQGFTMWQLHQRYDALRALTETRFKAAFPEVQNINDIRVQAEQEIRLLRAQQGSGGLFPLLQALSQAMAGIPSLRIESIQYRDGELYLSLQGESVQSVEALRAGFSSNPGAALTIEAADAGNEGVHIRARVRAT